MPPPCNAYSEWMVQTFRSFPCSRFSDAYGLDQTFIPRLPQIFPAFMLFTAYHTDVYAVSYRAKPDKAGGWGCNPHTENT